MEFYNGIELFLATLLYRNEDNYYTRSLECKMVCCATSFKMSIFSVLADILGSVLTFQNMLHMMLSANRLEQFEYFNIDIEVEIRAY